MARCSTTSPVKLTRTLGPLDYRATIFLLNERDTLPEFAERLGVVTYGGDPSIVGCTREDLLTAIKLQARKVGANLVKIESILQAGHGRKCDRIQATLYSVRNDLSVQELSERVAPPADSGWSYGRINLYGLSRKNVMTGKILLNDSAIADIHSNMIEKVTVFRQGIIKLTVQANIPSEFQMKVMPGKDYYVNMFMKSTEAGNCIAFELVDPSVGNFEIAELK